MVDARIIIIYFLHVLNEAPVSSPSGNFTLPHNHFIVSSTEKNVSHSVPQNDDLVNGK